MLPGGKKEPKDMNHLFPHLVISYTLGNLLRENFKEKQIKEEFITWMLTWTIQLEAAAIKQRTKSIVLVM